MKRILLVLLCCISVSMTAQVIQACPCIDLDDVNDKKDTINGEPIYNLAEEPPTFPGGMKAFNQYISQNMLYPETAMEMKLQGNTFVRFVIMKDGSVDSVRVFRSAGDKSLDDEAVRLVRAMPKWIPARYRGEIVNCWFVIPVKFTIPEK